MPHIATGPPPGSLLSRRELLDRARRYGLAVSVFGLAACASERAPASSGNRTTGGKASPPTPSGSARAPSGRAEVEGTPLVGDVLDFALTSDDWEGAFGFVTLRLHRGHVDGSDVFFVRTDASDPEYASEQELVSVPKLAALANTRMAAPAFLIDGGVDGQGLVLSAEPGQRTYTPACQLHRATWQGPARPLRSVADVEQAVDADQLSVEETEIVLNVPMVSWSSGALPVDDERASYLGPGQLLEPPDTDAMSVRFKLHECFPSARYILTDTALAPMAEGMAVAHGPALAGATEAGATGRTNVFVNGLEGPGPMGFQPSVFDTLAGDPEWSPYWDHMTYAWSDGAEPVVLTSEEDVHAARDAGDLREFAGTPDTEGQTFVVNCPVPVIAENTFSG